MRSYFFAVSFLFYSGCIDCNSKNAIDTGEVSDIVDVATNNDEKIIDIPKDIKEKYSKEYIEIIIPDVEAWHKQTEFPEPGNECEKEGEKRCLAPGNFLEGKPEYVVCERDDSGKLFWKEYKCDIQEIISSCIGKYPDSCFITEDIGVICQENIKGVFCCPNGLGIQPCDLEEYRTCATIDGYVYSGTSPEAGLQCKLISFNHFPNYEIFNYCYAWTPMNCVGMGEWKHGKCVEKIKGFATCEWSGKQQE